MFKKKKKSSDFFKNTTYIPKHKHLPSYRNPEAQVGQDVFLQLLLQKKQTSQVPFHHDRNSTFS